jgi:hypothetical protein
VSLRGSKVVARVFIHARMPGQRHANIGHRIAMAESRRTQHKLETPRELRLEKGAVFLGLAAIVFVAARFWHLTSYGLFGDEVFTLWTSAQDWSRVLSSVVEDVVHPPLFYALLKLWIDIGGQSLLWIKLLPVSLSILSIIPFLLLCRELKINLMATVLALWMMALNSFLIGHAQEPRMYSLLFLLVLFSLWLFVKLQSSKQKSIGIHFALGGANLLLVFTHYFGWVIVALELLCVLICRRDLVRSFAIAILAIAICFSPWAYLVVTAARANPSRATFFWNRPPPLSELVGYYANLNGPLSYRWKVFGTGVVLLVFLSAIVVKCVRAVKARQAKEETSRFWFLMLFAFGPVAIGFAASHLLPQSVWALRYLIIAAPAYFLIVAVAAEELRRTRFGITFGLLIAGWAGLSGFTELIYRDRVSWEPLVNQMIQAEHLQTNQNDIGGSSPVTVYVADPNIGNTIQFYLDKAGESRIRVAAVENLTSPPGQHSWVSLIRYQHESQPPLQDSLTEAGYRVGAVIEARAASHTAMLFPVWKGERLANQEH